ncbi:hypothetical protein L873DRAFT_337917 [Choiromyces venosus 120613-1]|uniref:Uncharacterized protein n=1 Tax=Choiromyces venosus 120613-1 TaxID=1336337 RepID=A0A3N4IZH2_9PEZI|nr:hypothetical protein L873DRAFT_337917 [Choiromyces venosus 120613-1]
MVAEVKHIKETGDAILKTQERAHDRIWVHLIARCFLRSLIRTSKEIKSATWFTLPSFTSSPMLASTRKTLPLQRERHLIPIACTIGDYEEFVVVDQISMKEEKFVFILEAKRPSLGQAVKQCLLAMYISDSNGDHTPVHKVPSRGTLRH